MFELEHRKTLAYIRVSTEHQDLGRQRDMIQRWCAMYGVEIGPDDWLEDDGISGGLREKDPMKRLAYYRDLIDGFQLHKRQGFLEMMRAIEDGKYNRVVLCEITRLSRNCIELMLLGEIMEAYGCELVSLDFGGNTIVLNTASGWLNWGMKCLLAQNEVNQTRERTRHGLAAKKANGIRLGNPPSAWMRDGTAAEGRGRRLIPDPKKWPTMMKVAALREAGYQFKEIAMLVDGINSKKVAAKWWKSWQRRHDEGFHATPEQCDLKVLSEWLVTTNDRYRLFSDGGQ